MESPHIKALWAVILALSLTSCRSTPIPPPTTSFSASECGPEEQAFAMSFSETINGTLVTANSVICGNFETQVLRVGAFSVSGVPLLGAGTVDLHNGATAPSPEEIEAHGSGWKVLLFDGTQIGIVDNDSKQASLWSGAFFGDARLSLTKGAEKRDYFLRLGTPTTAGTPCNGMASKLFQVSFKSVEANLGSPLFEISEDFCSRFFFAGGAEVYVVSLRVKSQANPEVVVVGHQELLYVEGHHNADDTVEFTRNGITFRLMVGRSPGPNGYWMDVKPDGAPSKRFAMTKVSSNWF